jgi:hypothetical protein
MAMRISVILLLALAVPVLGMASGPREVIEGCYPLTMPDVAGFTVPGFEDFPATEVFTGRTAPVDLRSRRARLFRTTLRQGAAAGPNFAGRYTIVGWGCGTSCISFAIVDAKTGRVFFPPGIDVLSMDHVDVNPDEPDPQFTGLRYRLDSRLLIVLGAPNEDESREGIMYYLWNGRSLERRYSIASRKRLCIDAGQ